MKQAAEHLHRLVVPFEHPSDPRGQVREWEPPSMSASAFLAQEPSGLQSLASAEGVHPVARLEELWGDFWPDDEPVDEFVATVRAWRRDGGYA